MRNRLLLIVVVIMTVSIVALHAHASHIQMQPMESKQKAPPGSIPEQHPLDISGQFMKEITMTEGTPGQRRARKPAPVTVNKCNMTTMDERVGCRLTTNISAIQYMPEGCRVQPVRLQDKCRELYGHTHKCLALRDTARRAVCMQKQANLQSIKAEHISCTRGRVNQTQCMQILRLRVDNLIMQSMYMLELRAIETYKRNGVSATLVKPFVKKMEGNILSYTALKKREEKIKVLKNAQKDWSTFIDEAKAKAQKTIGPYEVDDYLETRIDMLQELGN